MALLTIIFGNFRRVARVEMMCTQISIGRGSGEAREIQQFETPKIHCKKAYVRCNIMKIRQEIRHHIILNTENATTSKFMNTSYYEQYVSESTIIAEIKTEVVGYFHLVFFFLMMCTQLRTCVWAATRLIKSRIQIYPLQE